MPSRFKKYDFEKYPELMMELYELIEFYAGGCFVKNAEKPKVLQNCSCSNLLTHDNRMERLMDYITVLMHNFKSVESLKHCMPGNIIDRALNLLHIYGFEICDTVQNYTYGYFRETEEAVIKRVEAQKKRENKSKVNKDIVKSLKIELKRGRPKKYD